MEITSLTIKEIQNGFAKKEFCAKDVAESFLKRIKNNKEIGAYLSVFSDKAIEDAKRVDGLMTEKKPLGILSGIPCGIKDNIMISGQRCTAGSKILENYIAPYNAGVIDKLEKENSVVLGKLNLDEFAIGSSGEYSGFFPTKNPKAPGCVPGGSSAGPAAAVAGDLCVFSLGSDTGGSIRQPAAFCGVVGLKTTYGRVSRHGLIAMASSLDQIGPLTKNVEDAEIVFDAIKGENDMDSTSCHDVKIKTPKKFKIGIIKESMGEGIDREIKEGFNKVVGKISKEDIEIEEISLPYMEYGLACYYIIMTAEVSSNLARYDGVKYGKRSEADSLMETYFKTRKEFLGKEVKRRIMLGTYCLSAGYYDAYYLRALKVRTVIVNDFKNAFKKVDLLMMPTTPTLPFKFGERTSNPLSMYMADLLTVPANIAGLPAISIPCDNINGLPFGIQFVAPAFHEKNLFAFGKVFEKL